MLNTTKSITVSGNSMIDGKSVIYMSAQIPESGRSNINTTIQDLDTYNANKTECRADMAAFDALVYELEDGGRERTTEAEAGPVVNVTEPEVLPEEVVPNTTTDESADDAVEEVVTDENIQ